MEIQEFLSVFRIISPYMNLKTTACVLCTCKTLYNLYDTVQFRDVYKEQNYNDLVKITKRSAVKLCAHESQVIPEGTEYICSHYFIRIHTNCIPESVHTLKLKDSFYFKPFGKAEMPPYIKHLKLEYWSDNYQFFPGMWKHLTHLTLNCYFRGDMGMFPENIKYIKLDCRYGRTYNIPNFVEHLVLHASEFRARFGFEVAQSQLKFLTIKSNLPQDFVYLGTAHVKFSGNFNMIMPDNMFPNITHMSFGKRYTLPIHVGPGVKYLKYMGRVHVDPQLNSFW